MMRTKTILGVAAILITAVSAAAQGGKAEPLEIRFAKGRTSATVSGTLSNNQEMDYVFSARVGQTVKLTVTSKPKGNLFDFQVMGSGFELETEHDHYSAHTFTAPETGDYLVFVRKRPTHTVKRAKFYLMLSIN